MPGSLLRDTVLAKADPPGGEIMENVKESSDLLAALSDGMANAVAKIGKSVVRVNGRRRRPASGVVYTPDAVLTASHVLEREEDLSILTGDGRTLPARVGGRRSRAWRGAEGVFGRRELRRGPDADLAGTEARALHPDRRDDLPGFLRRTAYRRSGERAGHHD